MRSNPVAACGRLGRGVRVVATRAAAAAIVVALLSAHALAQIRPPPPPPVVRPPASSGQSYLSGTAGVFDVGTTFLDRLGALTSQRSAGSTGNNPQGGGADPTYERYRSWLEGYGITSHTAGQGDFTGDKRRTWGAVGGFGVTVAPGATIGLSVDQSETKATLPGNIQTGRLEMTQLGLTGSIEHGAWTFGSALIHGFGTIHSRRTDLAGLATANYDAKLWGALVEVSYYWAIGNARIVPKLGVDWTQVETDAFTESGGIAAVTGSSVTAERTRLTFGAEFGRSWLVERTIYDLAVYARFVDNLEQKMGALQISAAAGPTVPRFISGVRESNLGGDAGAMYSIKLSPLARIYAAYDGRFRGNFTAHSGTAGAEFRW